nr:choice-of-anchor Q domain-containing protein [uncultured Arsenicibacter sp.]
MNVRIQIRAIGLLCCLLLTHRAFSQTTRYVSTTGITPAASATTSWAASTTDLQGAIEASQPGDQVWVAQGLFKPTSTTARDISFSMKNGVSILGGFPPAGTPTMAERNPASYPTILSGDLKGDDGPDFSNNVDNSYHVIHNWPGLTNSAVLDGFVITGGNANGQTNETLSGGGVYNNGSSIQFVCNPSFRNCSFVGNTASYGGGAIYNFGTFGIQASPVLTNCSLQRNSANQGGAIFNNGDMGSSSSPILTNCSLQSNSATEGGAIYNNGDMGSSSPVLINCILVNNGSVPFYNNKATGASATYSLFDNPANVNITGPGNLTATTSPFVSATSVALAPCSPAINAGNPNTTTLTVGTADLTGSPRIIGIRIDMGAVEYQNPNGVPLQIVQQPVAGSVVCAGTTVVMSVSVTGSATAYWWYRSGTALTGIASATTASLTLTNVQTTDAGSYSVIISGDCPSVTSTAFSLSVNALPSVTVTAAPSATLSCTNPSLTLTAQTSATAFAWSGGGSTGQTLPVSQTGVYSVTVTGANGCSAVSNSPTIARDIASPTVSISAISNQLTCTQPQLTLTATASTTALRWPNGQTTTTISVSQTGAYSVTATGANGCSAVSNNLPVTENFSLSPFTVSSATVCPGQTINLTASGCGGQILWSTGATTAMITLTAGSSTSLLTATCTVGVCSTTASGQAVVGGIQPPPAQILSFTADESVCPVRLTGRGVASSFTMTGPKDYVFSTVYREGATHEAIGLNVKRAGTYILTATYTNSCGTSAPITRTVTVGRNCP